MKLRQNVCLHEMPNKFEIGPCSVKNYVTRSNLRKTLCTLQRPHFSSIVMKLGQNVCIYEILDEFENWSCWVKNQVSRSNVRTEEPRWPRIAPLADT